MDSQVMKGGVGVENPILEPEKTITGYALLTYAWVLALSTWGGMVNYLSKIRMGHIARFNITELIGDMFISGFTGVLTFWMCEAAGFNELTTAVFVGISGHMGARMIGKLEKVMSRKFDIPEDSTVVTVSKKEGTPGVF
jgi:hypothetical protein